MALVSDARALHDALIRRWRTEGLVVESPDASAELSEGAESLLHHLSKAVETGRPGLFRDYAAWAKGYLEGRAARPTELLQDRLQIVDALLADAGEDDEARRLVRSIRDEVPGLEVETRKGWGENPLGDLHIRYLDALMAADRRTAHRLVQDALTDGVNVRDIYLHVFQAAQREMGRRWQLNQVSVPQEHFCTAATQLIMSQLYDEVFSAERNGKVVVVTSVAGDLHEIGARMVADFFEMDGWDTVYLGANAPSSAVVEEIKDRGAEGLALSATMTPHVTAVAELIGEVRKDPEAGSRWILVGGYPFGVDPDLWREVGADAMALDALEATDTAARLSEGR